MDINIAIRCDNYEDYFNYCRRYNCNLPYGEKKCLYYEDYIKFKQNPVYFICCDNNTAELHGKHIESIIDITKIGIELESRLRSKEV